MEGFCVGGRQGLFLFPEQAPKMSALLSEVQESFSCSPG